MPSFSKCQMLIKGNTWKYLCTMLIVGCQNSVLTLGVALFAGSLTNENNDIIGLSKQIFLFFLIINFINYFGKNGLNFSIESIKKNLYIEINNRLLCLPLNEFGTLLKGNMQNLLSEDLNRITAFLSNSLVQLFSVFLGIFSSNLFILKIHWLLFVVNFSLGSLSFVYFRKKLDLIITKTIAEKKSTLEINHQLFSLLNEKKAIEIFGLGERTIRRNNQLINTGKSKKISVESSKASFTVFNTMLIIFSFISMMFIGFYLSAHGEISTSQAISCLVTSSGMIWMYRSLSENLMDVAPFTQSMNRYINFITTPTLEDQKKKYDLLIEKSNGAAACDNSAAIELLRMSIEDKTGSMLIKDISLKISRNDIIGFSGENGAGKTTLLNSLMGFYIPSQGTIAVNGKKFEKETLSNWRKQFVYISQKANLINGTVYENILLGTEYSKNDAIVAGKQANVDEIVNRLPLGYETIISNNKLSSGEVQRICLARAFLSKDAILLFDEPTSFLDDRNVDIFLTSVQKLINKRTIVIVSHQTKVLEFCNEVFVIKDKSIDKDWHGVIENAN